MSASAWALAAPAFLLAITLHEAAHAWVAARLGDPTARELGRVTLNPLAHLDLVGTLVFFVAGFGWAKPVPVDPRNLENPRRDGVWIAAAGPLANLVLALASAAALRAVAAAGGASSLGRFLAISLNVNLVLMVFNLLPLHPLDGSKVVGGLLPERHQALFDQWCRVGPPLLLGMIVLGNVTGTSLLGRILWPPVVFLRGLLTGGMV